MTAPVFGVDSQCRWCHEVHPESVSCTHADSAARIAHARRTDPETSHEAAESLTPQRIRESQRLIYDALKHYGPMTDDGLWKWGIQSWTSISPSGARTRRAELVAMGKVRDSGRREILPSGRQAIVWEAV